jgi:uncharacterized membrane protein YeaQ/YmgE (transglycosylase-associated protein family)
MIGSFLGGWVGAKLGISGAVVGGFSVAIMVAAFLGAVVLLFVVSLVRKI